MFSLVMSYRILQVSKLLVDTDMVRAVVNEHYGDYLGLVELKVEVLRTTPRDEPAPAPP